MTANLNSVPQVLLHFRVESAIYYGGYSLDYRKILGRERFLKAAIFDYTDVLTLDDFTEEDLTQIDGFSEEEDAKMEKGKEIETEPGFREQQRKIQRFVHQKALSHH